MGSKKQTKINGTISQIKFRSSEGWAVFTVTDETNASEFGVKITNCTGTLCESINIGDDVECTGTFIKDKTYGTQLKCDSVVPAAPDVNSNEGVQKLLQKLPGVGLATAKKAIKDHGHEKAWDYALNNPEKIGVKKTNVDLAKEIASSLVHDREALVYLLGIGLSDNQAAKIIKRYNSKAIDVVKNTPYELISSIDGFGFMIVDGIALKSGIHAGSESRIMACVDFILNSSENEGNTYIHGKRLCAMGEDFLIESAKKHMVPLNNMPGYQEIRAAIYKLQSEKKVRIEAGLVFSRELMQAEEEIFQAAMQKESMFKQ